MKSKRKTALRLICVLLLFIACISGLMWLGSHTYRDNESNFRRIFGFPRPANITVHHSEVWKGRHFFFLFAESSWHIELDAPQDFISRLTSADTGPFTRHTPPSDSRDYTLPSWFAPKTPDAYERWDAKDPSGDFTRGSLFIDKQSGRVYLYRNEF